MTYTFRTEGKDYPMVEKTEFWVIGGELADKVGHKNYSDFFRFVMRSLNLPHDYAVLSIVPDTIEELKRAHVMHGDYGDRKDELHSISEDAEKLLGEFEAEYLPIGFFGSENNEISKERLEKMASQVKENPARKQLLEHGTDITELARNGVNRRLYWS